MDTKAAFEEWYLEQQDPDAYLASDESGYFDDTVQMEWGVWRQAWTASRAAIEIDLPYNDVISDDTDEQWDKAVDACSEAITSHGIRIKGKTE